MSLLDSLQKTFQHAPSKSSPVLIVGTVALDSIETPFGKADRIVGGAATYASIAASFFVKDINLVSVIGSDFPAEQVQDFNKRGIHTEGLQIHPDEKSFFWSGTYHLDMNTRDTLSTELNVLENFDPVIPESYQNSIFILLGNLTPTIQINTLKRLRTRPKLIVLDTMNFWISNTPKELHEVLTMIDLLTINDAEARELSGEYSLVKAAKKILELGPKYLIIKKGEHGALLFHESNVFFAPALPLEDVFDPTGAGDTFAGGFIGYLAQTNDISYDNMKRAIIYGSAMASFCVEKFGTQRLIELNMEEIEERVQDFVDLVQFDIALVD